MFGLFFFMVTPVEVVPRLAGRGDSAAAEPFEPLTSLGGFKSSREKNSMGS